MKKKILIIVSLVVGLFSAGGIYIVATIQTATSKLDHLIMLHQVEILREHLLVQIKVVQSDLLLQDTPNQKELRVVMADIKNMEKLSTTCFDCHHAPPVKERLDRMVQQVVGFKGDMTRVLMNDPNRINWPAAQNAVLHTTEQLASQVGEMVHMASGRLSARTAESLNDISKSKFIVYLLVILTPLVAGGISYFFIREFTRPVTLLLEATRRLKDGELDFRVEGLSDEFAEVATSFNRMADALKTHMHAIEQSEKRYRALFESAGDAIFILEAEGEHKGRVVNANRAAAQTHGYSVDELLKLRIQDLDTPEEARQAAHRIERILNGEWVQAEIYHRRRDGSVFPVEISAGLLEIDGHKYILAFDRDITERKEMEKTILQSKKDWEDTFNNITDMITIHDTQFNIVLANKAAQRMLDLPMLDGSFAKCFTVIHGKSAPPPDCPSCECWDTHRPGTYEYYEPHLDRILEIRTMPRFDDRQQMVGLIHVIRDITERKRVEESLQRAEQMKLVGEWATALAHEIKNPLAGIKVSVEVLAEDLELEEDKQVVERAVDEIKRIETLLKSLLNFAKPPKPQPSLTDVNHLLEKTAAFSLKHPSLVNGTDGIIHIVKEFAGDLPQLMVDPMQLQQVFLNLLLNSIEAMSGGGTLFLKTGRDPKRNAVRIEIGDTGKGIEPHIAEKIFEPFFTTKKKGSGLGLAITKRLMEQHGGQIELTSKPEQGTVFTLTLPLDLKKKEQAA